MHRRVICVFASRQDTALSQILAEAGWRVEPLDVLKPQSGASGPECSVGVLELTAHSKDWLQRLQSRIEQLRQVTWIAVVDRELLSDDRLREFITVNCIDYQTTPLDRERVLFTLGHAAGMAALLRQSRARRTLPDASSLVVGRSPIMQQLRDDLRKVAAVDAPVLITGESGTGKELVARAIHQLSGRRDQEFVAVNCASVSPTLAHAEFFGFERGSFTGAHRAKAGHFEAAQGGTILLDEIGDLHVDLQALLLRLVEERALRRVGSETPIPLNVRILAATNVDLEAAVQQGRFRRDLYYRLNVLRIKTPALREHPQDIDALAYAFLRQCTGEKRDRALSFTRSALAAMCAHHWPGNVRELFNRVRRAIVMCETRQVTAEDLGFAATLEARDLDLKRAVSEVERQTLLEALRRSDWRAHKCAQMIGVSRATLYRLLEKHRLVPHSIHAWGGWSATTWLYQTVAEVSEAVECLACLA